MLAAAGDKNSGHTERQLGDSKQLGDRALRVARGSPADACCPVSTGALSANDTLIWFVPELPRDSPSITQSRNIVSALESSVRTIAVPNFHLNFNLQSFWWG